jgi:hypothetical protein
VGGIFTLSLLFYVSRMGRNLQSSKSESVEGETNPSDGESDELQSDHQKSTGDKEGNFPLVVDPAPTREAAPVGRAAMRH